MQNLLKHNSLRYLAKLDNESDKQTNRKIQGKWSLRKSFTHRV